MAALREVAGGDTSLDPRLLARLLTGAGPEDTLVAAAQKTTNAGKHLKMGRKIFFACSRPRTMAPSSTGTHRAATANTAPNAVSLNESTKKVQRWADARRGEKIEESIPAREGEGEPEAGQEGERVSKTKRPRGRERAERDQEHESTRERENERQEKEIKRERENERKRKKTIEKMSKSEKEKASKREGVRECALQRKRGNEGKRKRENSKGVKEEKRGKGRKCAVVPRETYADMRCKCAQ